jgi:predicted metal-dependent RNase
MSLSLLDAIKVSYGEANKAEYEAKHVREVVKHTITLKYGETTDITPDIRLTMQNAGHILGSAVCHFHIGDGLYNVAFTGDMKYERSWLFNATTNKFPRLETLVIESTYGGSNDIQPSRIDAATQLRGIIERAIMERKGKIIVPVFAVGRSQEVMLVIEELARTGKVDKVPVYLDGSIWEATAIHTAYPEYLNSQLRTQIFQMGQNPFLSDMFHRVDSQEMREKILHGPPRAAAPGGGAGRPQGMGPGPNRFPRLRRLPGRRDHRSQDPEGGEGADLAGQGQADHRGLPDERGGRGRLLRALRPPSADQLHSVLGPQAGAHRHRPR